MARSYSIISADSHLDLPPERWVRYLPEKWRARAPRRVMLADGNEALVIENRPPLTPALEATIDKNIPVSYDSPGAGLPEQRLREQDMDGVEAEVLFTHPMYMMFWRGIKEEEGYKAIIRAYNQWIIVEYCAYAPDRLVAMAVIPDTGINDAMEELDFVKRAGFKGICLHRFPSGKGYPTPEDDRFWAAAIEMGMPLTSHTNFGSTRFTTEGPVFQYSQPPKDAVVGRDPISIIARFASENAITPLQLVFAGVFDRFPTMHYYWAETQIGWLPYCLSQIDETYERHRNWAYRKWGLHPLAARPSDYLRARCLWGFVKDALGVQMRHTIGVDKVMWGSDFAHGQGYWPYSRKAIDESMVGVSEQERNTMLAENAIKYFRLDAD